MLDFDGFYAATYMYYTNFHVSMVSWICQNPPKGISGGFWRIQDMSNIYTGGFWWIQDTSIFCVTKLVEFGGFRILCSKNTQGVRVNV